MRTVIGILVVLVLAAGAALAWALRHPGIDPIDPPAPASFDKALVDKGEALVALGDCAVCHTKAGGTAFAGGLKLETPFGAIYSTNVTPDAETGIGRWSEAAFSRALREGVDRNGRYLYPALPYDHFSKVSDADIRAIYAYLMTRPPAKTTAPQSELMFPLNYRILVAGWNLLFLGKAGFVPDPSKDEKWNRGAYLVEGLGHCGACHTPRNGLGAEKESARLAGGEAEGWHAPALNQASPAPVPWTADALVNYLLDGWDENHGIAAGPMTPVVNELALISEDDAYAIAAYLLSFQDQANARERTEAAKAFADKSAFGGASLPPPATDTAEGRGQATFARVCANCHRTGTRVAALALSSTINGPDPRNLIRVIDKGIKPPEAASDRSMPAFRGSLGNGDLADLVAFVRSHFSRQPAWGDLPARIAAVRSAPP